MMRALSLAVLAMMGGPAAADTSFPWFSECLGDIGTETCSPELALSTLDGLEPAWGYHFRPAGGDAFAIVTVLGTIQRGLRNRIEGGDCIENEELAYYAGDVWAMYVSLDEDMSEGMAIDFSVVSHFVDKGIAYIAAGGCG